MKTFLFVSIAALIIHVQAKFVPDGRIVGGSDGDISDFQYQVSLRINGQHNCGGSIIGTRWIVTAAHCLEKVNVNTLSFRAGSTKYTEGGITVAADKIFMHPDFNRYSDYDVGLVRTKSDLVGENIKPISIPLSGSDVPYGQMATVSGWGYMHEKDKTLPTVLQYVSLPIIRQEECNKALQSHGGIRGMMFCAGAPDRDACRGDSGGPIVSGNEQIGVVSYGITCGDAQFPGVYTRLGNANVRAWIHNTAKL